MPYKFKKKKEYQQGGPMRGPSHARGGIDINVEGGEYMIKKKSVNPQTEKTLEYINKTGNLPQYDAGGRVQRSSIMPEVKNKLTGEIIAKTEDYSPEGVAEMQSVADSNMNYEMSDAMNRNVTTYPGGGKTDYNVPMYEKGGNVKKVHKTTGKQVYEEAGFPERTSELYPKGHSVKSRKKAKKAGKKGKKAIPKK